MTNAEIDRRVAVENIEKEFEIVTRLGRDVMGWTAVAFIHPPTAIYQISWRDANGSVMGGGGRQRVHSHPLALAPSPSRPSPVRGAGTTTKVRQAMDRPEDDDNYYDDDYLDECEDDCHYCGGDGSLWGEELHDPMWYLHGELYTCPCCGGSGKAKDCTFW